MVRNPAGMVVGERNVRAFRAKGLKPLQWGVVEVCSSAMYLGLCLLLIAAIAVGVLELIGFGSLTQLYGFNEFEPLVDAGGS